MKKHKDNPIKDMTEKILRNIPETRNSDTRLVIELWKYFYPTRIRKGSTGEEGVWLRDIFELPSYDSIRRWRQKFSENGQYWPTDWAVAKARGIKEDEWRVNLGYPTKEATRHPTKKDSYMDEERSFSQPSLLNQTNG